MARGTRIVLLLTSALLGACAAASPRSLATPTGLAAAEESYPAAHDCGSALSAELACRAQVAFQRADHEIAEHFDLAPGRDRFDGDDMTASQAIQSSFVKVREYEAMLQDVIALGDAEWTVAALVREASLYVTLDHRLSMTTHRIPDRYAAALSSIQNDIYTAWVNRMTEWRDHCVRVAGHLSLRALRLANHVGIRSSIGTAKKYLREYIGYRGAEFLLEEEASGERDESAAVLAGL